MSHSWPQQVFQQLKAAGVRQMAYVPMPAAAWLGGQRGVLLLQSSGVGNCINMLALNQECRIPLLALVTMLGEWGEYNPWQVPMGQGTKAVLEAAGVFVYRADTASEIPHVVGADNEHYGETGMQPAHTGRGTDLTGIATAAGFPKAFIVRTQEELDELAGEVFGRDGLLFA